MNLNRYISTAKHALVFGIGNVLSRAVAFILIPIYTSYFSPSEYGISSLISSTYSILHLLLLLGLSTAIYKYYFDQTTQNNQIKTITTATIFLATESILFCIIGYFLTPFLSQLILGSKEYVDLIYLMILSLGFTNLQIIPLSLLRAQKKSTKYIIYSFFNSLLNISLSIIFIVVLELGILGLLLAQTITGFTFMIIGLIISREYIKFSAFDSSTLKRLLSYGAPLIITGLMSFVLIQSDRFLINFFLDVSDVGYYSPAYAIGTIINFIFVQPFQLIWLPSVFDSYQKQGSTSYYRNMLTYYFLIVSWFTLGLSVFSKEILLMFTSPIYQWVYVLIPWIAYAYLFYGLYMVVNIGFYVKGKTSNIIKIIMPAAIINILINILLLPIIGVYGGAIATLIAYVALFFLALYFNRKIMPIDYQWRRIIFIAVINLIILLITFIPIKNLFVHIIIKLILLISYWLILFFCNFFSTEEKTKIFETYQFLINKFTSLNKRKTNKRN